MLLTYIESDSKARDRDPRIEELIAQMSLGEIAAMGDLYELMGTDVYAYAVSKTANKEDAEAVTHDTFVQIWTSSKLYIPMGKPLAWIFTVEINLIRKQKNRTKGSVPFDEALESESDGTDFSEDVIIGDFLQQMLKHLNEEEREVIALHIVSGLKHREIAKLLEKPLSTVISKYNRAIKKLKNLVKEREESK